MVIKSARRNWGSSGTKRHAPPRRKLRESGVVWFRRGLSRWSSLTWVRNLEWKMPRSISQLERWAEQLFPLLLLGVGEDGFELPGVVLAELLDSRPNLVRFAARLRLLYQGL